MARLTFQEELCKGCGLCVNACPKHLLALMSASNPTELNARGEYRFEMPQPIPSYLMALAVGDLRFQSLG